MHNAMLFLIKERHLTQLEENNMMTISGVSGFCANVLVVPLAARCGMNPYLLLLISVSGTIAHIAVYAGVASIPLMLLLEPLVCFQHTISIATNAIISGGFSLGRIPPKDQGTVLGVLAGFKQAASCFSPLMVAAG